MLLFIAQIIGISVTLHLLFRFLKIVYVFKFSSKVDPKKYGKYAVITGATDGIGKAYAKKLAELGMDIVLISRSESRLETTKNEIQNMVICKGDTCSKIEPKPEVVTICSDLASTDTGKFVDIWRTIEHLDIGVFVNNVGMGLGVLDFETADDKAMEKLITLNTFPQAMFSKFVFEKFLKQKRGIMINLSSSSAVVPLAFMSIYASTKRYNDFLSESLRMEVPVKFKNKILVQSVQPFFVETKSTHSVKDGAAKVANIMKNGDQGVLERMLLKIRPLPVDYVNEAIKTVGHYDKTFGSMAHQVLGSFVSLLPENLYMMLAKRSTTKMRNAALKKD